MPTGKQVDLGRKLVRQYGNESDRIEMIQAGRTRVGQDENKSDRMAMIQTV